MGARWGQRWHESAANSRSWRRIAVRLRAIGWGKDGVAASRLRLAIELASVTIGSHTPSKKTPGQICVLRSLYTGSRNA